MTITVAQAPLLPQIETILRNRGYKPVAGSTGLYMQQSTLREPLSCRFLEVTAEQVKPFADFSVEELSHLEFVTKNVKHLFPKVR